MGNPTVTPIAETRHMGGYVVSEANGHRSRGQVTIAAGQRLLAGTVLAMLIASTAAPSYAATVGNTGTFTCGAIVASQGVKVGIYKGEFIAPTVYALFDPDGNLVSEGGTGVDFASGGLAFKITAGGTAAIAGDDFKITVVANASAGSYVAYDPTAVNGAQIAAAILYGDCDATSAAKQAAVTACDSEVNASELEWGANVTTTNHKNDALAALKLLGIVAR